MQRGGLKEREKDRHRRTNRETDRQRQTDRQTDRDEVDTETAQSLTLHQGPGNGRVKVYGPSSPLCSVPLVLVSVAMLLKSMFSM